MSRRAWWRRPRAAAPRKPSAAQMAASERAWAEALGVVRGRFRKGEIVVDWSGQCWRLTRAGRRYHEDVSELLYPAVPCKLPAAFRRSQEIRKIRDGLLQGRPEDQPSPPKARGEALTWRDDPPGSLAAGPSLTVYDDVVSAYRPVYDDSGSSGWRQDAKLAARVRKLIAKQPTPTHLPRVAVRLRGAAQAAHDLGEGLRAISKMAPQVAPEPPAEKPRPKPAAKPSRAKRTPAERLKADRIRLAKQAITETEREIKKVQGQIARISRRKAWASPASCEPVIAEMKTLQAEHSKLAKRLKSKMGALERAKG